MVVACSALILQKLALLLQLAPEKAVSKQVVHAGGYSTSDLGMGIMLSWWPLEEVDGQSCRA